MKKQITYSLLVILLTATFCNARELDVKYDIKAFVDFNLKQISGIQKISVKNNGKTPIKSILLHLYPNRFIEKKSVRNVDYPLGFNKGEIEILSILSLNEGEDGQNLHYRAPRIVEFGRSTKREIISVILHTPLNPGDTTQFKLNFRTTVPERLGAFSYVGKNGGLFTLQGGWYPYVSRIANGQWAIAAQSELADIKVELILPSDKEFVSTGNILQVRKEGLYNHYYLQKKDFLIFTLIVGNFKKETFYHNGFKINLLSFDENSKEIKKLISRSIDFFIDRYDRPTVFELNFVESFLPGHLYVPGEDLLIYSHRLDKVFFVFKKYHRQRFSEGVLSYLWSLYSVEDRWVIEGLSAFDSLEMTKKEISLDKKLSKFSFIPIIDNIIYSDTLPMRNAYFSKTIIREPREDIFYYNNTRPHGSMIFEKINRLLGGKKLYSIYSRYADNFLHENNFETVLNSDGNLKWYYFQWLYLNPDVDFKIGRFKEIRYKGRIKSTINVSKAQHTFEPVDVLVKFKDNTTLKTQWDGMKKNKIITVWSDVSITNIELDPDGVVNDPDRHNNNMPAKWKTLLENFNSKYDIQTKKLEYRFGLAFQPVYRKRDIFRVRMENSEEDVEANFGYTYIFKSRHLPKIKQSFGTGFSIKRSNMQFEGIKKRVHGDVGFSHVIGTINFPLYPIIIQRMLDGIFPYTSLATHVSQRVTGNSHPYNIQMILEARKHFKLPKRNKLAVELKIGESLSNKIDEKFFIGGNNGLRGYTKTALQGDNLNMIRFDYYVPLVDIIEKDLYSIAFVDSLYGIAFTDIGTVGENRIDIFKVGNMKRDYGFGIACAMELLGLYPTVARFDVAFPISAGIKKEEKPHYYISIGNHL